MGLIEKAQQIVSKYSLGPEDVQPISPEVKKKTGLLSKLISKISSSENPQKEEDLDVFDMDELDKELNEALPETPFVSEEDHSSVLQDSDDSLLVDLDQLDDNLPLPPIRQEERQDSPQPVPEYKLSPEDHPDIDQEIDEDPHDEDELVLFDIDELPDEENLQVDTTIDESKDHGIEIDGFEGEQERIDIGDSDSLVEYKEDEILPKEIIDIEDSPDSNPEDSLEEWEKDAKQEAEKDPFMSVEEEIMEEISKEDLISDDLQEETLGKLQNKVDEVQQDLNESPDDPENDSIQRKLESYLVLVEITKELVKSKNFEDFFENLMYSIEGQVGPESILIFSAKQKDLKEFHLVAYDGLEVENEITLQHDDSFCRMIRDIGQVTYAHRLNKEKLSDRDLMILDHPSTEILVPIFSDKELVGIIVAGKLINDENYTEEDFEFLKLLGEIAGNFIMKMFDLVAVKEELSKLNESFKQQEALSSISDSLYNCKSFDELYDLVSEKLQNQFSVDKYTLFFISSQEEAYRGFSSNFFSVDTLSKLKIQNESKIITLVSQVSGMYKIENFASYSELREMIPPGELSNMKEFSIFPLIHMGKLFGMLVIHQLQIENWNPELKQLIISFSNLISPVVANLILQTEKDSVFKNPFNPVQETVSREISIANENQTRFTLVVLKILNVSRIINLLGLEFFTSYSDFIIDKLQEAISPEDYLSRVGQGKFAIFLRGKNKGQSEDFFSTIKQEFVRFPNPPKDFKLSLQLYSLTFPDQARDKRKFIEIIEDT